MREVSSDKVSYMDVYFSVFPDNNALAVNALSILFLGSKIQ
jgi:hypothetical protein